MARPWYTREDFRRPAMRAAAFLGVIFAIWISARIPVFGRLYDRVEAGVVRAGTSVGNAVSRLMASEESLSARFTACEADVRTLAMDQAAYAALQREVVELRSLLDYTASEPSSGVAVHVIARAVDEDDTRVLIDKGSSEGIVKGSAAVIDDGVLYGLVEEAREHSSVVRLVTHEGSGIPAAVQGTQRTIGLVEGRGGALLAMEFIPQEAEMEPGDFVVTSGLDGLVREGLVLGLVTEVVVVESAPFKRAFIELLYEPREWTALLILPPPGL